MLSSDFALIDMPIEAYCRQGISLRPSPIIITPIPSSESRFLCTFLIHSYFIKALCSGCRQLLGIFSWLPSFYTLSRESPDKICTYFFLFIKSYITLIASGRKFEWVFMTIAMKGTLFSAKYNIVAPDPFFIN